MDEKDDDNKMSFHIWDGAWFAWDKECAAGNP